MTSTELKKNLTLGTKYVNKDQADKAIPYFKKALKLAPENTDALYNLGYIFHEKNKVKETKLYYEKLIALKPKAFIPYLNLSRTLLDNGFVSEAYELCRKGLALKPNSYDINSLLADIYIEQGKMALAIKVYARLAKSYPRKAMAFFELACLYDLQKKYKQSADYFQIAIKLKPKDPEIKLVYVVSLLTQKKWNDAIQVLKKLIKLEPKNDEYHLLMAKSLEELQDLKEAKRVYRRAAKLGSPQAEYQLKMLSGKQMDTLPKNDVRSIFNDYAANFDHDLVNILKYRVPNLLFDVIRTLYAKRTSFNRLLDLGCGTGLVGVNFKDWAKHKTGVDLSQKMLKKAAEKKCYDALYNDDIVDFLKKNRKQYDLILSSDVLIYIGDLKELFSHLKKVMTKDGIFAFTTEHAKAGSFALQTSGRYTHSLKYIKDLAKENGLKIVKQQSVNLRKEYHQWIKGKIYVLERA